MEHHLGPYSRSSYDRVTSRLEERRMPVKRILLLLAPAVALASSEAEIRQALEAKYKLTERSKWSAQVTKPGTVLVVQKSGLQANTPRLVMKPTVVKNSQLEYVGGG